MKKTKLVRSLAALLTAFVLGASMGVTAFAADPYTGKTGVFVTDSETITFRKDIVLKNSGGAKCVYSPNITYTYSIAPVTEDLSNASVTDSDGKSIDVRKGISDGVTIANDTAAFTSERVALTDGTATVSKDLTATIHLEKFQTDLGKGKAGIYRYVITEHIVGDEASLTAQGISRTGDYKNQRYLDVYISNNVNDPTGDKPVNVSGYVIFAADNPGSVISSMDSSADTILGKTEGFVDKTEKTAGGEGASSLADTCYTYNLTVKVDILGSLADVTHPFPVTIQTVPETAPTSQSGSIYNRMFDYDVINSGVTTVFTGTGATGVINPGGKIGTPVTANLAKGDSITLYGLPANTSFNVTEKNNADQTYFISVKSGDITLEGKSDVRTEEQGTISAFDATTTISDKRAISSYTDYTTTGLTANYAVLTFTNTLNDVSLTGVTLRAAPYGILLGAGVLLGAVYLSSRKKKAPTDVL